MIKMLFIQFPLNDPLREPLLYLEWVILFLSFELGAIFIIRYKSKPKEMRNIQEISYASIFLSYSLTCLFVFILGDYFVSGEKIRYIMLNCGYFTQMAGTLIFFLYIEKTKIFFRKYLFSIIFSLLIILFSVIFIMDMVFNQTFGETIAYIIIWPLFFLCFLIYLLDIARKLPDRAKFKFTTIKFVLGIPMFILGLLLVSDMAIETFGLEIRIIGDILQLIGLTIIFFFFYTLPPFSEFDWQKKIDGIIIMEQKSGIRLYSKKFETGEKIKHDDIIAGAISSVQILLRELTKSEGISVIKKKENITIIYPSKYITGAIFCKQELNSLKILLQRFVKKIETMYKNILINWTGELSVFKPLDNMCNEIFSKD